MLPPQQAAVARRQRHHLIGNLLHQHLLLRIAHIQRWTHMQHPGVDVAEHAVVQSMPVKQRAELDDIVRQPLRRHRRIFDKGNRFGAPFGVAQQTYRLFTHVIDALNSADIVTELIANNAALLLRHQRIKTFAECGDPRIDQLTIVTGELDDIDAEHLFVRHVGDQFTHRMPDDIFARQVQHF